MTNQQPKLLNKREAAAYLNVSPRTVDRERSTGRLKAVHVRGRVMFTADELGRYVAKATR